jgi:hypothetical protein
MRHSSFIPLVILCFVLLSPALVLSQGSLTPPGAPVPTMKTLNQIEPRTDVATLPGDATNEHIINTPGSYYVSRNLFTAKTNCISIASTRVTLDLGGFEIARSGGAGGSGILVSASSHRVTIRNGMIGTSFANGIFCNAGSYATCIEGVTVTEATGMGIVAREGAIISRCRVDNQPGGGIQAGPSAAISHCTISSCQSGRGILGTLATIISQCSVSGQAGFTGIEVQSGGVITDCSVYNSTVSTAAIRGETGTTIARSTAYLNDTPAGITCGLGGTISHCAARSNTHSSIVSSGISAGSGSTVITCSADQNLSTAAALTGATGAGIAGGANTTILDCTARANTGDGIRLSGGSLARGNNCIDNGVGTGVGAGIHAATNGNNRIEGNTVTGNDTGLDVDLGGNFIVRNTATDNTSNYEIAAGNAVGTIVATPASIAISGSTGGAGVGSTDPWANFSF